MDYYHDEKMQKIFELLEEPMNIEDIDLSENFLKDLILKIVSSYGSIMVKTIHRITGLHLDIIEHCLNSLERDDLCTPISGGFMFPSVTYSIKSKGKEISDSLLETNPYIGVAPVPYDIYYDLMNAQLKNRYPLNIPEEVIKNTFDDVVGNDLAKTTLIESAIGGKGFFIVGLPGTGKTFITSKMSDLLPPIVIPKFFEFSGQVIQLFDPDFHKLCPQQPGDRRWVKIYAPFVFTGSELTLENLETKLDVNKGVYDTSLIIKANGGVLLFDDLGRQKEDHNNLLNRLIVPMENKQDMIYVKGSPVTVPSHFIPAFSTNLDITIIDEAHLRRAPLHVSLENPTIDQIISVFKNHLDKLNEEYDQSIFKIVENVYTPFSEGGEGLQPTFAHARDLAQIAQAIRIERGEEKITDLIVEVCLDRHVLISMQRELTPELFNRMIRNKK